MPEPTLNNTELDRYAPPKAKVEDICAVSDATTQPVRLFSAKGRIGRLRYICWSWVFSLVFAVLSMLLSLIVPSFEAINVGAVAPISGIFFILISFAILIIWLVFMIRLMIQRSHDMGWSGWPIFYIYVFLSIVCAVAVVAKLGLSVMPVVIGVIVLISLAWMIKSGTPGPNRFGPPPVATPLAVQVAAWIFVALSVLGFFLVGLARMLRHLPL